MENFRKQSEDIDRVLLKEVNDQLKVQFYESFRIEDLEEYIYKELKTEKLKFKDSKIIVLGLGGAGRNIMGKMLNLNLRDDIIFANIDQTDSYFEKLNVPIKYELYYPSKEYYGSRPWIINEIEFNRYYDNTVNFAALKGLFVPPLDMIYIIQGFGGQFSFLLTLWICRSAIKMNVPFTVLGTIPFKFEKEKREKAICQINSIEELGIQVDKLDAENLFQIYKETNLWNCYSYLDQAVIERFQILSSNI